MLQKVKDLEKLKIHNNTDELGYVYDFYVDDTSWTTRYVVVDTGSWLTGRKILISPHSLKKPNFIDNEIYTDLSKEEIEKSPNIAVDKPVSRQHEIELAKYYAWPAYWAMGSATQNMLELNKSDVRNLINSESSDSHLRSIREIRKYNLEATDGEIGIVDSYIIDDDKWIIKYLVVDTRSWLHWLPGGKFVLIAPEWVEHINWSKSKVKVNLDRETIENSPEFNDVSEIDEKFKNRLYNCYKEFIEKDIVELN